MAAAEALMITRGIDDNVRDVGEKIQSVDVKVQGVDDKVGLVIKGELYLHQLAPESVLSLVLG